MHQHAKNQLDSSIHSCHTEDFRVPWLKRVKHSFDRAHPIIINYSKNRFIPLTPFWDIARFRSPVSRVATLIFDLTHPNIFLSTLNSWYQYAKKQAISSLCPKDIFDLKILQSDWQKLFWPNMTEKKNNRFTAFTFGLMKEK